MTNVAKCNRDNTIDKEQQIQEVKNFLTFMKELKHPLKYYNDVYFAKMNSSFFITQK